MLQDFIKNFKYKKGTILDGFRIIDSEGDCDDFALTSLFILESGWRGAFKALIKGKARLWFVKSPQNKYWPRHIILRWTDHLGTSMYIDSTVRKWRDSPEPHNRVLPLPTILVAFMALWGATLGKFFK